MEIRNILGTGQDFSSTNYVDISRKNVLETGLGFPNTHHIHTTRRKLVA